MTGGVPLDADPRWRRFTGRATPCPCCGRSFSGVFDLSFDHPDAWPHGSRAASGQDWLAQGEDLLGADLCQCDGQKYVRCVLPLPIRDSDQTFAFGVWGSVSDESATAYAADFFGGTETFEGCFAWLANGLPGIEMQGAAIPCNLIPDPEPGQRPHLTVHQGKHPLADMQREGITFDRLLDIYAAAGQDIRPHLMDA